jgi:YggT family protein
MATARQLSRMLSTLAAISQGLRTLLLAGGAVVVAIAALDFAVRTRRINPFSGIARFIRLRVDPRLAGIERMVLRAGGEPSAAPWWGVVAYVVFALLLLALLDFALSLFSDISLAFAGGPIGILWLVVHWTFGVLIFALIVRVLSSWFPAMARSRWVGWSFAATDWMLRPLRRVLPPLGMVDISPLVAYFGLTAARWLVESILFRGVR